MDPDVAMTIDKLPDSGGTMGREIICNNVDLLALGKAGHDLFKESNNMKIDFTALTRPIQSRNATAMWCLPWLRNILSRFSYYIIMRSRRLFVEFLRRISKRRRSAQYSVESLSEYVERRAALLTPEHLDDYGRAAAPERSVRRITVPPHCSNFEKFAGRKISLGP